MHQNRDMKIKKEKLQELDKLIYGNDKLEYVMQYRKTTGCGIPEAITALTERYKELRKNNPNQFSCSDEEYWKGFYS